MLPLSIHMLDIGLSSMQYAYMETRNRLSSLDVFQRFTK